MKLLRGCQRKRSLCQGKNGQYFHMNALALRSTLWDERQKEPEHPGGGKNWGLLEVCEDSSKHLFSTRHSRHRISTGDSGGVPPQKRVQDRGAQKPLLSRNLALCWVMNEISLILAAMGLTV